VNLVRHFPVLHSQSNDATAELFVKRGAGEQKCLWLWRMHWSLRSIRSQSPVKVVKRKTLENWSINGAQWRLHWMINWSTVTSLTSTQSQLETEGNAIPSGRYVGYFFSYITIGCRKNAEIYSGNLKKVTL